MEERTKREGSKNPREKQPGGDPATKGDPGRKPPKPSGSPGKGSRPTKPAGPRTSERSED